MGNVATRSRRMPARSASLSIPRVIIELWIFDMSSWENRDARCTVSLRLLFTGTNGSGGINRLSQELIVPNKAVVL